MNKRTVALSIVATCVIVAAAILNTGSYARGAQPPADSASLTDSSFVTTVTAAHNAENTHLAADETLAPVPAAETQAAPESVPQEEIVPQAKDDAQSEIPAIQSFLGFHTALCNYDSQNPAGDYIFYYGIPFLEAYESGGVSGYGVKIENAVRFAKEYFGRKITKEDLSGGCVLAVGEEYFDFIPTCYDGYDWTVLSATDLGGGVYRANCAVIGHYLGEDQALIGTVTVKKESSSPYGFILLSSAVEDPAEGTQG